MVRIFTHSSAPVCVRDQWIRSKLARLYRNQVFDFSIRKAAFAQESSIGFCPAASFRLALVASWRAFVREISGPPSTKSRMVNRHSNRKIHVRLPGESTFRRRLFSTYTPGLNLLMLRVRAGRG